jgi:hypothetical protein
VGGGGDTSADVIWGKTCQKAENKKEKLKEKEERQKIKGNIDVNGEILAYRGGGDKNIIAGGYEFQTNF